MITLNWQPLVSQFKLPAQQPGGVWASVFEYVIGPRKLKIVAAGEWDLIVKLKTVGPEGDAQDWDAGTALLLPGVPRGSLIAKIGGGSADKQGTIFPVGQKTVIDLADPSLIGQISPVRGSLFLAMNDEPKNFVKHSGDLTVDIWEAS
jgi:hypothetical protein